MATIFQQALNELDEVKRGLSTSNAKLFAQAISAAEKAEDALKTFISAADAAKDSLAEMLKVQALLTGKPVSRAPRGSGTRRASSDVPEGTYKFKEGVIEGLPRPADDKNLTVKVPGSVGRKPAWFTQALEAGKLERFKH